MGDISDALLGAVERGEIRAVFQPQIDLTTDEVVGAEALCRWRHPRLGDVPPDQFIPIAEETGVIDEIGRFMVLECLRALRRWAGDGRRFDVSVNVSPVQLEGAAFTDWFTTEFSRTNLRGSVLTLEITEGRPVEDVHAVVLRLDRLRRLGVGIAIDDFGSGQSSLQQLRRLHGTELKLDRSIVIDESVTAQRAIEEVVAVAHDSGIRVVAEGIETERQLKRVRDAGCDRAQGYLLGRPMPPDDLCSLIAS